MTEREIIEPVQELPGVQLQNFTERRYLLDSLAIYTGRHLTAFPQNVFGGKETEEADKQAAFKLGPRLRGYINNLADTMGFNSDIKPDSLSYYTAYTRPWNINYRQVNGLLGPLLLTAVQPIREPDALGMPVNDAIVRSRVFTEVLRGGVTDDQFNEMLNEPDGAFPEVPFESLVNRYRRLIDDLDYRNTLRGGAQQYTTDLLNDFNYLWRTRSYRWTTDQSKPGPDGMLERYKCNNPRLWNLTA